LFIGANGLGKTTTTFLIIYGIVGDNESINRNYFKKRRHEPEVNDERSTVLIDFVIGGKSIFTERYLDINKIKKLVIDGTIYDEEEYDGLEEYYNKTLIKYTGIKKIEDIAFLLSNFLIREEEGNYLLWDSMAQSKLLRLLINVSGFEEEYSEIAQRVQYYDTLLRGNQDIRAQFVKRQTQKVNDKEQILLKKQGFQSRKDVGKQITTIESEINSLKFKRLHILDNSNYYTETLKSLDKEIEQISSELEVTGESILKLENEFYSDIYSDEKVLSAIHKLKTYNICIYCNNKPDHDISEQIIHSVEHDNICPVCNTKLINKKSVKKSPKSIINLLSRLKNEASELNSKLIDCQSKKESILQELNSSFNELKEYDKDINFKSLQHYELKKQLADLNSNPEERITEFDSEIMALQKQIEQYDIIINESRASYDDEREKLVQKNNQYNNTLKSFVTKLNQIFTGYASTYFNESCKLVADEQQVKKSKVPLTTYIPEFENKKRMTKEDCSTSERMFLEYIFRLSLVELYINFTRNSTFLILETSEGSFDISNTRQLGNSLTLFSRNDIPFIIIANFSRPDFILLLLSQYTDKKERVLNFLQFGRLSKQQEKSKGEFNRILGELELDRF
jgi:hypothetical protein